ncbi:MAG: PilT/PilU family type 4a pilus ATPase, partial [Actinomycetota bacterium]|nr:PilT/PilU family type 4a pilus ATPase [Actinomycetota bacterium]
MVQVRRELGEVLLELGLVTEQQMEDAAAHEASMGQSGWKMLLETGVLSERDLVRARASQAGMGFADLRNESPSPGAVGLISGDIARRQLVLPLRIEGDSLILAMAEPTDHLATSQMTLESGKEVRPVAVHRPDLLDALARAYGSSAAGGPPRAPGNSAPAEPATRSPGAPPSAPPGAPPTRGSGGPVLPPDTANGGPAVVEEEEKDPNLADFLTTLMERGGSDLHLTTGSPPVIRVNGDLLRLKGYRRLMPVDMQNLLYAILTQKQREVFEENLELDLSYQLPGKARFRVNVFQQRDAMGAVMRLIPFEIKSVADLGLPSTVKDFTNLRRGMVLVTGVTGSGKSTTLAALVDKINAERPEHIMTVEDPIEFLHRHKKSIINQREVGTDTHGFAEALKHVLRQDPDVILVGEMRDLETISTALTAAETGHLVFGTLHTQDAPQSVDRIIDVFPPHQQEQIRVMLAGALSGIVSQQLVP